MSLLKKAEKRGRKFLNPVPTRLATLSVMLKAMPLYLHNKEETEPKTPLGPFFTNPDVYATPSRTGLRVTWFGHSSMLVEIDGFRVLIDPVWDKRASPLQSMGPKRFFPPTIPLENLPRIDVVLISHDHFDHLGEGTVRAMAQLPRFADARWITSLGVGQILTKFGVAQARITELDWTESVTVQGVAAGAGLKVTAWPARHFSGRSLFNRFHTLWSCFVLEGPEHRVLFGADSGWWDGFAEIASKYDRFDLTMLEIGAYHPLWANIHLGPEAAVRAMKAMEEVSQPGPLMPIHWGLFNLALHGWRQPIETLEVVAAKVGLPLWCPKPGVPSEVEGPLLASEWRRPVTQA